MDLFWQGSEGASISDIAINRVVHRKVTDDFDYLFSTTSTSKNSGFIRVSLRFDATKMRIIGKSEYGLCDKLLEEGPVSFCYCGSRMA